jgi:hypothetical protein
MASGQHPATATPLGQNGHVARASGQRTWRAPHLVHVEARLPAEDDCVELRHLPGRTRHGDISTGRRRAAPRSLSTAVPFVHGPRGPVPVTDPRD